MIYVTTAFNYLPSKYEQFERSRADWDVQKIVYALKGWEFNGFIELKNGRKLYSKDAEQVRQIATRNLENEIVKKLSHPVQIVPCPNKCMRVGSDADGKIESLAYEFSELLKEKSKGICTALKWNKEILPSHSGGVRNKREYQNCLSIVEKPDMDTPILLFDDVYTTGTTMGACYGILKENGYVVLLGASYAKTIWKPIDRPISCTETTIKSIAEEDEEFREIFSDFDWDLK